MELRTLLFLVITLIGAAIFVFRQRAGDFADEKWGRFYSRPDYSRAAFVLLGIMLFVFGVTSLIHPAVVD